MLLQQRFNSFIFAKREKAFLRVLLLYFEANSNQQKHSLGCAFANCMMSFSTGLRCLYKVSSSSVFKSVTRFL